MNHPQAAEEFIRDRERTSWHDEALWFVRERRDRAVEAVPEWETLRDAASQIKDHVLANLDTYLEQFEAAAANNGVHVHWARDAKEHNQIVLDILRGANAKRVVKSKSMLTEECHLNPSLENAGVEVIDTDLGERIVQLAAQPPSHIVMPAIHFKKEEIGAIFHERIGTEAGMTDPTYLTKAARAHLRDKFLSADAAITGVNFAVAESGGIVVCTNEGNADLGVHLARAHIASMGIEKVIPRTRDLAVFLRVLARSATGQAITAYTSHFLRPRAGADMHVIIVDNGRTRQLGRPEFRSSLRCIRCGACLNTCPVYRRSGGHSYGSTISGPIGAILSPGIDLKKHSSLPFASTLCGSCSDVCPVKIDIHEQLYKWRQMVVEAGLDSRSKSVLMSLAGRTLARAKRYERAGRALRFVLRSVPKKLGRALTGPWGKQRDWPDAPRKAFRDDHDAHAVKPRGEKP